MTSLDVFVPCYNYGRFLRSCIDSLLHEPGCTLRVLIIDDSSTDDSLAIARTIAATDPRVDVLAHATNKGHIATYNDGIAWVRADYMLLLSADDLVAPGALARAVALMDANPQVGFVHGRSIQFSEEAELDTHRAAPSGNTTARIERGQDFIAALCARPVNQIETATVVVRSALQQRVGGYLPELPHSGDLEMWLRLAAHADLGVFDTVQAFTRIHARNMRHGYRAERMLGDYRQRHLAFRRFFEHQATALPDSARLDALAGRRLAEEILWSAARAFEEGDTALIGSLAGLARQSSPSITRTSLWWKLVARQQLGPSVWRAAAALRRSLPGGAVGTRPGD